VTSAPIGMRQARTGRTRGEVARFLDTIEEGTRRQESERLIRVMRRASGTSAAMWGAGTVGFGSYHFRYASGREGDWFKVGFAPRPRKLTIYLMSGFVGYDDLLSKLGSYERSKSCLYLRHLTDVDPAVLERLVDRCVAHLDQVERDLGAIPRMSAMPPFRRRRR